MSLCAHSPPSGFVIFGGSAGARLAYDTLELLGLEVFFAACYVNDHEWGSIPGNTKDLILGSEEDGIAKLKNDARLAWFVATGHNRERAQITKRVSAALNGSVAQSVVHPSAVISQHAEIGPGCQVSARAVIQVGAKIGKGVIIASGSIIEHDCKIGDFAQVCPGVTMTGRISIGPGAFIGAGSTILPNVKIGEQALVAAGSVVISDVGARTMVAGNPAVPKREVREDEI
eukprot:TRINITY_DN8965_c0_g1_i1.p1 TRINITY_DN8965_c0_g1~~TRINITY_DN8965_c0_g1_i1.p1  ORF type:complete len:249 (+),score=47.72 TRINITY_DN8965_c0_g1_i1:58-747(+)